MKNILPCLLFVCLSSCSDGTTTTDESAGTTATPVENVNGNIPDTTNSVSLDNSNKTPDSSHLKDSTKK